MKIFMGNPDGYGDCVSTECEKCPYYKPIMEILGGESDEIY